MSCFRTSFLLLGICLFLKVYLSDRYDPAATGGGCEHQALLLIVCLHTQLCRSHSSPAMSLALPGNILLIDFRLSKTWKLSFLYHVNFLFINQTTCSACLESARVDAEGDHWDGHRRSRTISALRGQLDFALGILLICIYTCSTSLEQDSKSLHLLYLHFCQITSHLCPFGVLTCRYVWAVDSFVLLLGGNYKGF